MMLKTICFLVFALGLTSSQESNESDYSNGFGTDYKWHANLASALEASGVSGKPVMVIIHKSWCGHCLSLAEQFRRDNDLLVYSEKFEMVNCMDKDEPPGPTYAPDGRYIPRIIFVDKNETRIDCQNVRGLKKFKYYFFKSHQVIDCMLKVSIG